MSTSVKAADNMNLAKMVTYTKNKFTVVNYSSGGSKSPKI